jgi:hypothetical protein
MATKFKSKLFYGKTGFFDSVGIGVSEPENGLHISGADFKLESGQAYFQYRPLISGSPVMLYGDTISVDVSDLYPRNNPSGFITGISNLVYTTGNQSISGVKTFVDKILLSDLSQSSATTGQMLAWNGSAWQPTTPVTTGTAIQKNTSDVTPVNFIRVITQAEYDALPIKDENTIYFIKQ